MAAIMARDLFSAIKPSKGQHIWITTPRLDQRVRDVTRDDIDGLLASTETSDLYLLDSPVHSIDWSASVICVRLA